MSASIALPAPRREQTRDARATCRIPQTYALVAARGDSQARIDGIDAQAPVFLAAGPHTLDVAGDDIVWLVWSAALQRGLSRADIVGGDMQHADCT